MSSPTGKRELGWRAVILKNFTRAIAAETRLTVVTDPDQLLTEQEMLSELRERGFDLVPFDDHVAFRFAFESRYRQVWDRGEKTNLVVVLRSPSGDPDSLPFDLLEQAKRQDRCLAFSVAELFPKLSPSVVFSLDRSRFQKLHAAIEHDTPQMGEDQTKDFILRHVFEIAPETIKTDAGLLKVLLRRHYRGDSFPPALDEYFIRQVSKGGRWKEWPLAEIVPSRPTFLAFLDERWPYFIRQVAAGDRGTSVGEAATAYGLTYDGPTELPFDHDDVKIYIDNLFQEGQLTPVPGIAPASLPDGWMRMGVAGTGDDDKPLRFSRLMERLASDLPTSGADHRLWVDYAQTWAEWTALRWDIGDSKTGVSSASSDDLHDRIETQFSDWMQSEYASLYNLASSTRPAMVHHIPHHLAHNFTPTGAASAGSGSPSKHAMIVIDGLALDQWVVLRNGLAQTLGGTAQIEEDGTFAWVPTITSVSRQSIFAGKMPYEFASSINTTSTEPAQWKRFWEDKGAKRIEIGYVKEGKGQKDEDFHTAVMVEAENPKMRMLGIVIGKVDASMHGEVQGTRGLHAMVKEWAKEGGIARLLNSLLDLGFQLTITADHGNIDGTGIGKPNAGVIANTRGERAHIFNDANTRANFTKKFAGSIEWPAHGLPEEWNVLLAPGRSAFAKEGTSQVGHGGIAMEEVIVPFVKITRGER